MKYGIGMKHGIVVRQRIVSVVIAERSFRFSLVWRHMSDEGEFAIGEQTMPAKRIVCGPDLFIRKQRSEHQLGNIFRKRSDRRNDQRRRPAEKYRDGQ